MKKIFLLCALFSLLFSFESIFAASPSDIGNANFLAREQVLVDQSADPAKYRLGDPILRQEIIGIALKLKGITLPESYSCKKTYTDVINDDWICRAVELAAENGMITKANKTFRPTDNVTIGEAVAILFGALNQKAVPSTEVDAFLKTSGNPFPAGTADWQIGLLIRAKKLGVISDYLTVKPNAPATRADVFSLATKTLVNTDFAKLQSRYGLKIDGIDKVVPLGNLTYQYGDPVDLSAFDIDEPTYRTFFLVPHEGNVVNSIFTYYASTKTGGLVPFGTDMLVSWIPRSYIRLGQEANIMMPIGYFFKTDEHIKKLSFEKPYALTPVDVLRIHYGAINEKSLQLAHEMLATVAYISGEVGVPLPYIVFQAAYSDAQKVLFREDSIVDLGDNTYEFLLDITKQNVTTQHRVRAKIDLEKFKIHQLSSVKV